MAYFVTGATGFIGRFLVAQSAEARRARSMCSCARAPRRSSTRCATTWGAADKQVIAIDRRPRRSQPRRVRRRQKKLKGKIDHFFHLAAIYDLTASAEAQQAANVDGTRHAVEFAEAVDAGCFHHVSSIAAAGLYDGVFREDMFEEAEDLDHPYFKTKHDSEGVVRKRVQAAVPHLPAGLRRRPFEDRATSTRSTGRTTSSSRCRSCAAPAAVDADDRHRRRAHQHRARRFRRRCARPPRAQEGPRRQVLPPDRPRAAPHRRGAQHLRARGSCAADDACASTRGCSASFPAPMLYGLGSLAPVKRMVRAVLTDLGIPKDVFQFINWPTRYDNREATKALKGSGIAVPHARDLRREAVGLLGAQPRPGPLHRPHARGPREGQGHRRHRLVVRASARRRR